MKLFSAAPLALCAALLSGQSSAPAPKFGPALPPGSNQAFQEACLAMEERMEKGDFEGAKRVYRMLPKLSITLGWDDTKASAAMRPAFAEARDRAVRSWEMAFNGSEIKVVPAKKGGPPPQILISFVEAIAPKPDDPLPPGAVHFSSLDPAEPRIEAVLSLTRGRPSVPADFADVHNEVAYAIAQYYGLERSVKPGTFSSRTDVPTKAIFRPASFEWALARKVMEACDSLASAAVKGERLVPARPRIHISPLSLDGGSRMQGDQVELKFQATNVGNAALLIKSVPDCSCVSAESAGPLYAGESKLLTVRVDLTEVRGLLDKSVLVYSNDSEKTVYRMPIKVRAKPMYTYTVENGGSVLMKKGGMAVKAYFVPAEGQSMKVTGAKFDGIAAKVSFRPWTGPFVEPGSSDPPKTRSGYVLDVVLSDQLPPGRTMGSLWVYTDHPIFKRIYTNLYIQKGIVALPDQLKIGEIPAAPRRATFLVSRPRKGFKLLKVETDSPFLAAEATLAKGDWEYRVVVQFNGRAAPGPLTATITVRTNDPEQPVLKVPFSAMVR